MPTEPVPGISPRPSQDYQRRRSSEILRTIYISRGDIASYITLCKATRLTEADCQTLATMLLARRKPADALSWAERGLALGEPISGSSMESGDLLRLKSELLTKLGRRDEAIQAAWTEFGRHPSEFSYEELMKYVPKAEKETWHKKAIEAAMGTDLDLLLPLLLKTKELEWFADLAGRSADSALERVSHLTTEPAARKLEKTHPRIFFGTFWSCDSRAPRRSGIEALRWPRGEEHAGAICGANTLLPSHTGATARRTPA
jgi:hypothetical protein